MQTFKNPLTASEEKRCLEEMQQGSLPAKNLLIEHNMRLVAHVIKKYLFSDQEMEELISIGTIGLIKAVNTFDPKKGNRLSSYAARCIENEILMVFRSEKKRKREVSLYDPIGVDKEGNEIQLMDVVEAEEAEVVEFLFQQESVNRLYQGYFTCLKEKEQMVIRLRYGLFGGREYTQREIGTQLQISRSYVSRIEKSALAKLRTYLGEEYDKDGI